MKKLRGASWELSTQFKTTRWLVTLYKLATVHLMKTVSKLIANDLSFTEIIDTLIVVKFQ